MRVTQGPQAGGWTELERALLRGVDQMMARQSIDDATYAVIAAHYGPAELIDYVMLVAEFILVALVLNVFQVARDPGLPEMPAS